ncbi:MAG: type II toxin-antitoxin system prevent-host-death family antitoxin [Chloroflexota bacterium]|nr:type II toxin-antitoxin system prevent-host-death family antitoxin [Chloroflexota bacterium]
MVTVTIDEAKLRLLELIRAVEQGEMITITRDDQPIATLSPVAHSERRPVFGSHKGSVVWMAEDFDAPLDDFGA